MYSYKNLSTYQDGFHNKCEVQKMLYKPFGSTQLHVSIVGFGGSTLALCYDTDKELEAVETVISAVKNGINYIDTAPLYGEGKAEIVLGKALKQIPRSTYYLATKVGRYGMTAFDFSAERTMDSINESLKRLQVDYVDILQVHDLEFAPSIDFVVNETLPTLQRIKEMGKTKYIGITGYPISKLKEVLDKSRVKIDMVLSYCRCTLFDDALKAYIPFFKEKKLAIINAAVLGMGLLTSRGPPEWHPADSEIKIACNDAVEYCKDKGVNISKLALCHCLRQPDINVHLVGMENKEVLQSNLDSMHNGLTSHEEKVIKEITEKYFKPLSKTHWENKEVEKYWEKMKEMKDSV